MTTPRLELTRGQILGFRRRTLVARQTRTPASLRRAAWAGLQDSMPRAALLSLHARVAGTGPTVLDDPSLVQLWGPRYSAYVVAARDLAVFSLGRLPDHGSKRHTAEDLAARLHALLGGESMPYGDAGRALAEPPNRLRYATLTGRVLIQWDGARQPTIRTVPQPDVDPQDARLELARRYLHVFGPTTAEAFAKWAGIASRSALAAFDALATSLTAVRTPMGEAHILSSDEQEIRSDPGSTASVRLLPSGDSYFLLWGEDRRLLVPRTNRRDLLWTSRVWPGALLVDGEIVGTWRRSTNVVAIEPWRRLSRTTQQRVAAEACALPLPNLEKEIAVQWADT